MRRGALRLAIAVEKRSIRVVVLQSTPHPDLLRRSIQRWAGWGGSLKPTPPRTVFASENTAKIENKNGSRSENHRKITLEMGILTWNLRSPTPTRLTFQDYNLVENQDHQGYLKKLKTMRKKYFVLRGDSAEASARLEYYESEKKWKTSTCNPKRTITLKNCFNINKKLDTRHKWVIALYTRNDKFCIVFDNEEEMEDWLQALLSLQQGEKIEEGGVVKPNFEHVWEVFVHSKQLGSKTNMTGPCRLCLTDQAVTLVRREKDETLPETCLEYSLQKIRCCGHVDTFFYMEVGQWTATGAGNLWLQAEDTNIAENIHHTILKYLQACGKNANREIQPPRPRAVSVTDSDRRQVMTRWSTHTGLTARDRSDTMPTQGVSRPRTSSECVPHLAYPPRHPNNLHSRPLSSCNRGISYSPPAAPSPISPGSATCSDSAGSSLSMDGDVTDGHWEDRFSHSLTPDEPVIVEENTEDYAPWIGEDEQLNNYVRNSDTPMNAPLLNTISCHNSTNNLQTNNSDYKSNYSPSQVSRLESLHTAKDLSYMIMTPGANVTKPHSKSSANHSRGSSLTEEGYVPMAPGNSDDGYVDMDHGSTRHRDHYQSGELSAGSSCSMTSGTPSTDQRFSDYPLDKVISYFPDEEIPAERHPRSYSVGSRPNLNRRAEIPVTTFSERARASSLGSKNGKGFNSLRMHNQHHHVGSSHSSVEPSDDMMEMDFSKKGRMKSRKKPSSSERLSVPCGSASTLSSAASSYSTAEGSYMEMSPRCSPSLPSPPKTNRLLSILGKSPPKHDLFPFTRNSPPVSGYPSPSLGRVPEIEPFYGESSQQPSPKDSYMEMKPKLLESNQKVVAVKNTKARIESFPTTANVCQSMPRSKCTRDDHFESSLKRKMSHTCTIPEDNNNSKIIIGNSPPSNQLDDYVEMDLGTAKSTERSLKSKSAEEDYMEMDGRGDKIEYGRSQPIAIQSNVKETNSIFSSLGGRKNSTGTSPKRSFLQFGSSPSPVSSPYGTLGRSRPRKNTLRRDSRGNLGTDSSGSASSIFPMSLNSSINSPEDFEAKCQVDATSGTVILSPENSRSVDDLTNKLGCCIVEDGPEDYVPYEPGAPLKPTIPVKSSPAEADYAQMAPVKPPTVRKTSMPLLNKFDRFLMGLGVGQLTSSTSSPSIKLACTEPAADIEEPPSLPEEEEEEEENPAVATVPSKPLEEAPAPKTPPAVKEKELHYASLDLRRSGSESEESNKTLKTQNSLTESSSASSPSPNPSSPSPASTSFTYAEIDFAKTGTSSQNP
ncbi:hypothetical protein GE061_016876 [Apolygus lucorum]|uniref:Insulin receptor substrate 1 n=1 Tax=Apolygus lucorum TaxID=248454 RepID=A0A8S9XH95_APOLU|nr:hypothetical protein GE061_016876 [Apolygus lucorum]